MTKVAKKIESNVCEISISYSTKVLSKERVQIHNSKDIQEYLTPIFSCCMEHHEEMWAIYMNNQHRILGTAKISQGGLTETTADPKIILQIALKANASSIIIAHNHPSGNPYPSTCDDRITQKIREGAKFLDMQLTDHIVMCDGCYYSYSDEGKL